MLRLLSFHHSFPAAFFGAIFLAIITASPVPAQGRDASTSLMALSRTFEDLSATISPAVVQIWATA
jgi:hypothetical protein